MKKIPTEIYSRIVGYYRPVTNWNLGKQEEYGDRVVFTIGEQMQKVNECAKECHIEGYGTS